MRLTRKGIVKPYKTENVSTIDHPYDLYGGYSQNKVSLFLEKFINKLVINNLNCHDIV